MSTFSWGKAGYKVVPRTPPPARRDIGRLCRCLIAAVMLLWRWCQVAQVHWSFLKHKQQLTDMPWEAWHRSSWLLALKLFKITAMGLCFNVTSWLWGDVLKNTNLSSVLLLFWHHAQKKFFHCWVAWFCILESYSTGYVSYWAVIILSPLGGYVISCGILLLARNSDCFNSWPIIHLSLL